MQSEIEAATPVQERLSIGQLIKTAITLFKLRVVSLLLFAALGGAFLGARGVPSWIALIAVLMTGALAAGGASAINQFLEREADSRARRTSRRPLASGQIERPWAILFLAVAMILIAVLSVLPFNAPMAFYLALGALIYVGVYTVWLKPRSVLNIVIGGAAGSCAVMTGGAAVGAASDPAVIVLALLVFLWTPAHFWALAMFYKEDYAAVEVPMLPVRATATGTAWWIFVHAFSTGIATLVLAFDPVLGWAYAIPTGIITAVMMFWSAKLIRYPERRHAIRLFVISNFFLMLVLLSIIVVTTARQIFFS